MKASYARSVDDALAIAEHEWRSRGVDRHDIAALSADLRQDLEAASADGVSPDQLVGPDIRGFARRLADESGARRVPYEYRRLLITALAGAVPGALLGYLFLAWVRVPVDVELPARWAVFTYYGIPALVVVGGCLVAVSRRMRDVPEIRRTVAAMSVLVPVVGAAITPVTMGFAALTGYSTALPVLLFEVALVGSVLAGAIMAARRWALRAHHRAGSVVPDLSCPAR